MASVGIYDNNTNNYEHFCTGSIIDKKFVLTAAHCFETSRSKNFEGELVLLVGTKDLAKRRVGEAIFIHIKRAIKHHKYKARK